MSEKPTTAIVKAESYAILKVSPDRRAELITQTVGPVGVDEFDLPRAKIPSGGITMFEVPTLEGSDYVESIEGVIIGWHDVRVYWEGEYGEGQKGPPDCTSLNGEGTGNPGGACDTCPLAEFGSDPKEGSNSQACQQRRIIMLMRPESLLPLVISLPPTSVRGARKFFFRLLDGQKAPHEVVTSIRLIKDTNAGGIEYTKATFRLVEQLSPELVKQFADICEQFSAQLKVVVTEEAITESGKEINEVTEVEGLAAATPEVRREFANRALGKDKEAAAATAAEKPLPGFAEAVNRITHPKTTVGPHS